MNSQVADSASQTGDKVVNTLEEVKSEVDTAATDLFGSVKAKLSLAAEKLTGGLVEAADSLSNGGFSKSADSLPEGAEGSGAKPAASDASESVKQTASEAQGKAADVKEDVKDAGKKFVLIIEVDLNMCSV